MQKKTVFVIDKFLPEEQRGKKQTPEWVERMQDYLSDVLREIKRALAEAADPGPVLQRAPALIDGETVRMLADEDVTYEVKIEHSPQEMTLKLTLSLSNGQGLAQNCTFTQTAIL